VFIRKIKLEIVSKSGTRVIEGDRKKLIMTSLREADPEYISAPCGGMGTCKKCKVRVTGAVKCISGKEIYHFSDEEILACRYSPAGNCKIVLQNADDGAVISAASDNIEAAGVGLGIAVDIGTTTIAMLLYELETGKLLGDDRRMNAQRAYGADVLSRIEHIKAEGLEALCNCLNKQLLEMAESLCNRHGRSAEEIKRVVISGNTIMQHFAAGLDPSPIAVPPFTPFTLFGKDVNMQSVLSQALPKAKIYFAPCISGYVGGDMISGLAVAKTEGLTLYMDIGTNGEIALGDSKGFACCATAAGPAFEGAELSCGMNGGVGAIDKVEVSGNDILVHVIGDTKARGICGSGVIDAVYAMLRLGVISKSGRFAKKEKLPQTLAKRFEERNGTAVFMLAEGVYLSRTDIRNLQLAKAAIRAGAEVMLKHNNKDVSEIDSIVIAGGFGSALNVESAIGIGLLPDVPKGKVSFAGNAALKGAAAALTEAGRRRMEDMAGRCTYIDLSSDKTFPDIYIKELNFN